MILHEVWDLCRLVVSPKPRNANPKTLNLEVFQFTVHALGPSLEELPPGSGTQGPEAQFRVKAIL